VAVHQLGSFRVRLGAGALRRREAHIARRRPEVGNRIVARHMHAHDVRTELARFVHRPTPVPASTLGAVFIGPVARQKWLPALLAFSAAIGTRFRRQKTG
jgi:hypothetical protein